MGWGNPAIIAGFVIGIVALVVLVKIEGKSAEPLIPLKLFKNSQYTVLLIVGFICYFYQSAMNVYAPIGAMRVMGASTSAAGALQMPRTIITIFLPTMAGVWVGKKASNAWKAMVVGTLFVAVPMAVMGFTTPSTSIIIYFVALTITGIAESYRSVSITPSAQATLQPADMGVGTSRKLTCKHNCSSSIRSFLQLKYSSRSYKCCIYSEWCRFSIPSCSNRSSNRSCTCNLRSKT